MNTNIRPLVRGAYDIQKIRIEMGNRLVANFKSTLGVEIGVSEEEGLSSKAKELIGKLKDEYKLLGTAVAEFRQTRYRDPKTFTGGELIHTQAELCLVEQYIDLENQEKRMFKRLEHVLQDVPIYTQFLSTIKGIGPQMAGVIISEIDIHKARYPSSLWKYAGIDVIQVPHVRNDDGSLARMDSKDYAAEIIMVGEGRSRRAHHLVDVEYTTKDGEQATRKSITFNPWLKTKLVGVLSSSFMRLGNEKYVKIYQDYKFRLQNRPDLKEESKGHINNMAKRYMIKIFLLDLYTVWRALEGLPVAAPYHEAKLGIVHGQDRKSA